MFLLDYRVVQPIRYERARNGFSFTGNSTAFCEKRAERRGEGAVKAPSSYPKVTARASGSQTTFSNSHAKLAIEVCQRLTQHRGLKQDCERGFVYEMGEAKKANAIELPPRVMPEGSWITGRA